MGPDIQTTSPDPWKAYRGFCYFQILVHDDWNLKYFSRAFSLRVWSVIPEQQCIHHISSSSLRLRLYNLKLHRKGWWWEFFMTFSRNMILFVQNVDKAWKSSKGVFKLGQICCCRRKCSDPVAGLNAGSNATSQQQLRQSSEKLALW